MTPVLVVATFTVREHSRRKLIAAFVIISVLITALLAYLAADSDTGRVFGDSTSGAAIVLAGFLSTFALIAALTTSMGNIGRPFNSGEALLVLARPISRAQYVLGRLTGGIAVTWALIVVFAVQTQVVQLAATGGLFGDAWQVWGVSAFNLAIVAALTTMLSAFFASPIVAALLGWLATQLIGGIDLVYRFTKAGAFPKALAGAAKTLWAITPKFLTSPLSRGQTTVDGSTTDLFGSNSVGLAVWALAWFAGFIVLSIYLASRKDV